MIRYDRSEVSIVIHCSECPHWRGFAIDQDDAYSRGERHAIDVHDAQPNVAANARRLRERRARHAA